MFIPKPSAPGKGSAAESCARSFGIASYSQLFYLSSMATIVQKQKTSEKHRAFCPIAVAVSFKRERPGFLAAAFDQSVFEKQFADPVGDKAALIVHHGITAFAPAVRLKPIFYDVNMI